jgi:UDP-N-acetylmuramyl pentapeptide phosphotransferase/UDP-N-acetylglucosamine-1-phosphate transferase
MLSFQTTVPFLMAFIASFGLSWMLTQNSLIKTWGQDSPKGIQKFHTQPASRLGGVALMVGLCVGLYFQSAHKPNDVILGLGLLLSSVPVFLGGVAEDLTHKVTPTIRMLLTLASCALVYLIFQMGVHRTDIWLIDSFLALPGMPLLVTLLVTAGFVNAINIIDGFHGLASGSVLLMLMGISALAFRVDDPMIFRLSLMTFFVTLGFFILNWPRGSVFLGDGGAYLLGLWVVELGLLLPHRTPELSPMAPVLVGIYPLVETLFTMTRRKFIRNRPVGRPDALHLHTLIYRRIFRSMNATQSIREKNWSNGKVSIVLWTMAGIPGWLALIFWNQTAVLLFCMLIFSMFYIYLYQRLVRFKTPLFLARLGLR